MAKQSTGLSMQSILDPSTLQSEESESEALKHPLPGQASRAL